VATTAVTHHPMRIDGEAVDADELYEIVNPASEEVFATAARGSVADADMILPGRET
jgi:acyl-CoA reductase-like NAD-dependent aldehyde dehydrogenase